MPNNPLRVVVSTVGASLVLKSDLRDKVSGLLNEPTIAPDLQREVSVYLEGILPGVISQKVICDRSAELNGIITFYHFDLRQAAQDYHILIATDTAIGRACADAVRR